jgi:hypothetical protein
MAFMASAPGEDLTERQGAALQALVSDLRTIFGSRLLALVAYGLDLDTPAGYVRTLALVERVTFDDLARAAPLAAAWQRRGLAVPLLLSRHEFERTLDVFPLEYGNIIANHVVIVGDSPFAGTRVADADRRRGCEQQAKSHLIHLREAFLEAQGDSRHVARLITSSAPAFRTLLTNLARLDGGGRFDPDSDATRDRGNEAIASTIERTIGVPASLIVEVLAASSGLGAVADPTALFSRYIEASERIWRFVDGWRA